MCTCTDVGWEGVLRNLTSTQPELGSDVTSLSIQADTSLPDIAHVSITDLHDTRWRVPESLFASVGKHVHMLQSILMLSSPETLHIQSVAFAASHIPFAFRSISLCKCSTVLPCL